MTTSKNNIPTRTVLKGKGSKKSRPVISKDASEVIKKGARYRNKKMSQGVISYEILKFRYERHKDFLDHYEKEINKKLKSVGVDPENIDKVKYCDVDPIDTDTEETEQVAIWLPHNLNQSLQQNPEIENIGAYLDECVAKYITHPYSDRLHRAETKENIFKFIKYDANLNGIAKEIYKGDSLDVLESLNDTLDLDINNWGDIKDHKDLLPTWKERVEAIQSADHNSDIVQIINYFANIYDIETEEYAERKIRQNLDMSEVPDRRVSPDHIKNKKYNKVVVSDRFTIEEIVYKCVSNGEKHEEGALQWSDFKDIYKIIAGVNNRYEGSFKEFYNQTVKDVEVLYSVNINRSKVIKTR